MGMHVMMPKFLIRGKKAGAAIALAVSIVCLSIGYPSAPVQLSTTTCSEVNTFHPVGALDCCRGSIAIPEQAGFRCFKRPKPIPYSQPVELLTTQSAPTNKENGKLFSITLKGATSVGNILYHLKRYDISPSGESSRKLRSLIVTPASTTNLNDTTPSPAALMSVYKAFAYTQEGQLIARGNEIAVSLRTSDDSANTEKAIAANFQKRRDALKNAFRAFLSAKSRPQRQVAVDSMRIFNSYMRSLSEFELLAIQKSFTQFDEDYRSQLRDVFHNIVAPTIEKPDFWARRGLEIMDLFAITANN
jgi:hypothetical protein